MGLSDSPYNGKKKLQPISRSQAEEIAANVTAEFFKSIQREYANAVGAADRSADRTKPRIRKERAPDDSEG